MYDEKEQVEFRLMQSGEYRSKLDPVLIAELQFMLNQNNQIAKTYYNARELLRENPNKDVKVQK